MSRRHAKQQRPGHARSFDRRAKMHLREIATPVGVSRVLTLRPGTDLLFSTNRYHETWHVITDIQGASALSRLMWGLSYQRAPGTIVLIDGWFLAPNPFDAAPSSPIVLANVDLGVPDGDVLRRVLSEQPRTRSDRTVRLQTHGLDVAAQAVIGAGGDWWHSAPAVAARRRRRHVQDQVAPAGGAIVFTWSTESLRSDALAVHRLVDPGPHGDEAFIGDDRCRWPEGEVQVFGNYRRRVSSATIARQELQRRIPDADERQLELLTWSRGTEIRHRQNLARRRRST